MKHDLEKMLCYVLTPVDSLYHDCDPKEAAHAVSLLKSQSLAVYSSPLTYAADMDIPTTYLYCEEDRVIPYGTQLQYVKWVREKGAQIETVELKGSSHTPFMKDPGFVAAVSRRVAGEKYVDIEE